MTTTLKTLGIVTLVAAAVVAGTAYAHGPQGGFGRGFGPGQGMMGGSYGPGQGPCATLSAEELAQRQELRDQHWAEMQTLRDQHRQQMIDQGLTPQGPRGPQTGGPAK